MQSLNVETVLAEKQCLNSSPNSSPNSSLIECDLQAMMIATYTRHVQKRLALLARVLTRLYLLASECNPDYLRPA